MVFQYNTLSEPLFVANFILWIITFITCFVISLIYLIKFMKIKDEIEKLQQHNIITWIIFFLILGITNFLNVLWRFFIIDLETALIIDMISIYLNIIAWFIKIFNVERGINHSKIYKGYYFSILSIFIIIIYIIFNPLFLREFGVFQVILVVLLFIQMSLLPGIFFYLGLKYSGSLRKNSIIIAIAATGILAGMMLQPQNIDPYINTWGPAYEILLTISYITCPIVITIGIVLIYSTYQKFL